MAKKPAAPVETPANIMGTEPEETDTDLGNSPPAQVPQVDFGPVIKSIETGFSNLEKTVKGMKLELPKIELPTITPPAIVAPPENPPAKKETKSEKTVDYRLFDEFDVFP